MIIFWNLLKTSIASCKHDPIILFPYLLFYFISHIIFTIYPLNTLENLAIKSEFIGLFIGIWSIEILIKCIIYSWIQSGQFKSAYHHSISKLIPILTSLAVALTPFVGILIVGFTVLSSAPSGLQLLILMLLIVVLVPAVIVNQFLPLSVLLNTHTLSEGIGVFFKLMKFHIKTGYRYTLFIFTAAVLSSVVLIFLSQIPLIGKSVGVIIFKSIYSTILTVFTYNVYVKLFTPNA